MPARDLTHAELVEFLRYDPETGNFTRIKGTKKHPHVGGRAGCVSKPSGYRVTSVCGSQQYEHRLAWLYMTGAWPVGEVDHINGVKSDNRWVNLRDVSRRVNTNNVRAARSNNRTGLLGVSPHHGKFAAHIRVEGRKISLGHFSSAEEAHQAYVTAKREWHEGANL